MLIHSLHELLIYITSFALILQINNSQNCLFSYCETGFNSPICSLSCFFDNRIVEFGIPMHYMKIARMLMAFCLMSQQVNSLSCTKVYW